MKFGLDAGNESSILHSESPFFGELHPAVTGNVEDDQD